MAHPPAAYVISDADYLDVKKLISDAVERANRRAIIGIVVSTQKAPLYRLLLSREDVTRIDETRDGPYTLFRIVGRLNRQATNDEILDPVVHS